MVGKAGAASVQWSCSDVTSLNILAAFPYYTGRTSERCPLGWKLYRGSCYFFLATRQSYQDAFLFCGVRGGYLAEVQSDDENRFVAGMLPSYVKLNVWIGYNDLEKEGRWLWTNTKNSGTYTNWNSGEPDNKNDQDCAVIETFHGRTTWDDQDCDRHEPSVCEAGLFAWIITLRSPAFDVFSPWLMNTHWHQTAKRPFEQFLGVCFVWHMLKTGVQGKDQEWETQE